MCKFCDNIATVENRDPMAECQMYLVPVDESVALVVEHIMDDETSFFFGTVANFCIKCGRRLKGDSK